MQACESERIPSGDGYVQFLLRKCQAFLSGRCGDCMNMLLSDLLDLRLGQSREIRGFCGDDSLERLGMMGLQILAEEMNSAALACCMTDEDDRFCMDKIRGDLLVVRFFLGNVITLVVSFYPMNKVMLKSKRIIWLDSDLVLRQTPPEIVENVGRMMIHNDNHSSDLMCLRRFPKGTSFS